MIRIPKYILKSFRKRLSYFIHKAKNSASQYQVQARVPPGAALDIQSWIVKVQKNPNTVG